MSQHIGTKEQQLDEVRVKSRIAASFLNRPAFIRRRVAIDYAPGEYEKDGVEKLLRVLVVYHHLPHYRFDVFRELESDPTLEVEFVAASRSRDGSIRTIPSDALRTFHLVRNHWIGRSMWQSGLLGLLVRRRPDIVIFLGDASYLTTWLGALLSRTLGSRVLFWTIGWGKPDAGVRRIVRLLFYRLADKLLLYGDAARDIGLDMGFPATRMSVIYNSSSGPVQPMETDPKALAEFAAKLPPGDRPVATAVIRLNPVKRLDLLVEAAGVLRSRGTDVDVLLVGEGPELARLTDQASSHGVRMYTPGPAYGDAPLRKVYDVTDVTVVPSVAGLTVLQSLKFGRPVITHDNLHDQAPESEAIIPGRTGDYYRHGDIQSLADVMDVWLTRQRGSRAHTAEQCIASLDDRWTPHAQYRLIRAEIDYALHSSRGTDMRILVVNPYGRRGHVSGPCILMERLFSTLAETNDVVVLGGRDAAPPGGYGWARTTVGLSANDSLGGLQQLKWSARAFLWLLARGRQFDLVHFHGGYLFNLVPTFAARLRGVPYAVIALGAHGDLSANSRLAQIPPLGALRRNLVSHATVGYALADDIRAEFESLGLSPERIHSLDNAVDIEKYQLRADLPNDRRADSRTLVFVGKVGRLKRATMILDAVAMLREHGYAARAVLVGPFEDDGYEQEFRRRSQTLGLDDFITITGHVTDVHSYLLSDVSFFVLPSAQEGLPGALVEALAAGLPCAVTDVGAMGKVVRTAKAGQIIEPTASAIAAFADKAWADVDQWHSWSRSGRSYAIRHYSLQRVAEQYLAPVESLGRRSGEEALR